MKEIKRLIDVKSTRAYVEYVDGSYGHTLLQWVPEDMIRNFNREE